MPKEDISGGVNNSFVFFIKDNNRVLSLYNFPYNFQSWGLGLNDKHKIENNS